MLRKSRGLVQGSMIFRAMYFLSLSLCIHFAVCLHWLQFCIPRADALSESYAVKAAVQNRGICASFKGYLIKEDFHT